jgi:hypothetical protein
MRMSARQIRSINRSIARVNGIICGASDTVRRIPTERSKPVMSVTQGSVLKIVAVPKVVRQ